MEFKWEYAEPLLQKLNNPNLGSKEHWMYWFEESWAHLSKAGLTQVQSPLDDTLVRLRILALCWLTHDFCGAVEQNEWSSCPYWEDWIGWLDIDPIWALLTALDQKVVSDLVADSGLRSPESIEEEEDEGFFCDDDEINSELVPCLVMAAVFVQREKVIDALWQGFDGYPMLFGSMYAICYAIEDEIDQRKDSLEEELEELEKECEEAPSEEATQRLRAKMDSVRQQLARVTEDVTEEFRYRALGDSCFYGDEETLERLNGFQWCSEGCPVVITGHPGVYTPYSKEI